MKAAYLFLLAFFLLISCASAQVSDTNSFFSIAETSVLADGAARFTVTVYIRDAGNQPMLDKIVTIVSSRGPDYDSIVQPAITNALGQCTGYISSVNGGWDTVAVVCDLKTIGTPFQWVQTSQEDFSKGETATGIDTTSTPDSIKLIVNPQDSSQEVLSNDDGINQQESWMAQSFQVTKNCIIDYVQVDLNRTTPDVTGVFAVSICVDSGSSPGNTITTSDTKDVLDLVLYQFNHIDWCLFNFPIKTSLAVNTIYWLKLKPITLTELAGNMGWGFASGNPYNNGYMKNYTTGLGESSFSNNDYVFRIYIKPYSLGYFVSQYCQLDTVPIAWGKLIATQILNNETVSYKTFASDDGINWDTGINISAINDIQSARKKYIKWQVNLSTDNTDISPVIDKVTINYLAPASIYFVPAFKLVNLAANPGYFSPNADGAKDTTAISYELIDSKPQDTISVRIYNLGHNLKKTLINHVPQNTGPHYIPWDGIDNVLDVVPDGTYVYEIVAEDSLGNFVTESGTVVVDTVKPMPAIAGVALGKLQVGLKYAFDEAIDTWQVFRSIGDTAGFTLAGSGTNEPEWLDTGPLGNDQKYFYFLIATDLAGNTKVTNTARAILTLEGGILSNMGIYALPNSAVKCKDIANAYIVVLETQTFGNTADLIKIEMARKEKLTLEAEGKLMPVDKKLVGAYEINAFEVDGGYNKISAIKNWQAGKPIKLVLCYDSCPAGKEGTLSIYEWSGKQWVGLGGDVAQSTQTISLDVNHFSTYAVMYQSLSAFVGAKPNPFSPNGDGINDRVEIRFDNPGTEEVEFFVFDLTGTTVRTDVYPAGTASIFWDGRDEGGRVVEGGAYIWQVEMGTRAVNGVVVVAK